MKNIKCKCNKKLRVFYQGNVDTTIWKKVWRRGKRIKNKQGPKIFRWKHIKGTPLYQTIYRCKCGEHFIFSGPSKAKTLQKINNFKQRNNE
jgi:hypothetical protein